MSEYDTLYSFLETLIKKKPDSDVQNEIVQPLHISAIVPDTILHRKRGRPPGSKNKKKQTCQACFQQIPTKQFMRHCTASPACKTFYAMEIRPPILEKPIHQLIIEALETATSVGDRCRFCNIPIDDMKQHMIQSQVCNRLAYAAFKVAI